MLDYSRLDLLAKEVEVDIAKIDVKGTERGWCNYGPLTVSTHPDWFNPLLYQFPVH